MISNVLDIMIVFIPMYVQYVRRLLQYDLSPTARESQFSDLLNNWINFYDTTAYVPINTLFLSP